jgi:hypothetical protein
VHSLTDRIDILISKETELQEECTELAKTNKQLNEQMAVLKEQEA